MNAEKHNISDQKVVTHNGIFHADEVFAIALLKYFNKSLKYEIIRTRDVEKINSADMAVDVGGEYNDVEMRFDHHQNIELPASNMLIFDWLCENALILPDMAEQLEPLMQGISDFDTNQNEAFLKWEDFNEARKYRNLSNVISGFNRDPKNTANQDIQFAKAIQFAIQILYNEIYAAENRIAAEHIYARKEMIDYDRAIFDIFCPIWKDKDELTYVIQPNPQGWAVMTKNSTANPLPPEKEIREILDLDPIFVHKGRFIAIFASLEEAKKLLMSI